MVEMVGLTVEQFYSNSWHGNKGQTKGGQLHIVQNGFSVELFIVKYVDDSE